MKNKKNFLDACVYETMNSRFFFAVDKKVRMEKWSLMTPLHSLLLLCIFLLMQCERKNRVFSGFNKFDDFFFGIEWLRYVSFLVLVRIFPGYVRLISNFCKNE